MISNFEQDFSLSTGYQSTEDEGELKWYCASPWYISDLIKDQQEECDSLVYMSKRAQPVSVTFLLTFASLVHTRDLKLMCNRNDLSAFYSLSFWNFSLPALVAAQFVNCEKVSTRAYSNVFPTRSPPRAKWSHCVSATELSTVRHTSLLIFSHSACYH